MPRNVEIKAEGVDPVRVRSTLREQGAREVGTDRQVDTYFNVERGRLKLREGNIENYLIYYERADQPGPKQADIYLYETEPDAKLKSLLEAALGVRVVVEKTREIYFVENVKFHIDEVEGLGSYMEIEAIDRDGEIGVEQLRKQCESFLQMFDIREDQLVASSYSDLLVKKRNENS